MQKDRWPFATREAERPPTQEVLRASSGHGDSSYARIPQPLHVETCDPPWAGPNPPS